MRAQEAAVVLATIGLTAVAMAQTSRTVNPAQTVQHRMTLYTMDLPADWRQMTPDEFLQLRANLPKDMQLTAPHPQVFDHWGPVEAWLAKGFDGRCLTIRLLSDGEPPVDDATVQRTREHVRVMNAETNFEVSLLEIGKAALGPAAHPTVESKLRIQSGPGSRVTRSVQYLVPTGGRGISFDFRSFEGDEGAAELRNRITSTLRFAKPPKGPHALSDKLIDALLIGALVGMGLIVLRWLNRRPTGEPRA